jgi:hypothetical protein
VIEFIGHVAQPQQIVFEQLADMAELSRWNPNVTASQRTSGHRLAVGSTYVSTIRRGPLRMVAHSTLTAVELGRSVITRNRSPGCGRLTRWVSTPMAPVLGSRSTTAPSFPT